MIGLTQTLSPADCLHWSARTWTPTRRSAWAVPRFSAGRVYRSSSRTCTRMPRLNGTSMHEFHSTTRGFLFCISCTPLPATNQQLLIIVSNNIIHLFLAYRYLVNFTIILTLYLMVLLFYALIGVIIVDLV